MAVITIEQLDVFKRRWLPSDAVENGWDDVKITDEWTGTYVGTTRAYWYDRVQQTASYLDLNDSSGNLPITQIHNQAKAMLKYWDDYIAKYGYVEVPGFRNASVGKIKRRYPKRINNGIPLPNSGIGANSAYHQV